MRSPDVSVPKTASVQYEGCLFLVFAHDHFPPPNDINAFGQTLYSLVLGDPAAYFHTADGINIHRIAHSCSRHFTDCRRKGFEIKAEIVETSPVVGFVLVLDDAQPQVASLLLLVR